METIKAERSPKSETIPLQVCRLCLSADRTTGPVESLSYAYGLMTDWAPQGDARICWECRAALRRVFRFKLQAARALQVFESVQGLESVVCLTRLRRHTITRYDAALVHDDNVQTEQKLTDCEVMSKVFATETAHQEVIDKEEDWEDYHAHSDWTADSRDKIEISVVAVKKTVTVKASVKKTKKKTHAVKIEKFTASAVELAGYRETALLKLRMHTFKCATCIVGFQTEGDLESHHDTFHSEAVGAFPCDVCACRFRCKKSLARHRAAHVALYRCAHPGCDFVHAHAAIARAHAVIHAHGEDEYKNRTEIEHEQLLRRISAKSDSYECDYCGRVFKLRRQINAHMQHHTRLYKSVCEMCGRMFVNIQYLKRHMLAHLDPSHRRHECDVCQKRFTTNFKLLVHTRSHTGERPFKCENCEMAYPCKDDLKRHVKLRHSLARDKKKVFNAPRTKSFFINKRHYPRGNASQTKRDSRINNAVSGTYECHICEIILFSYADLKAHFAIHGDKKLLHCNECEKTYKFYSQLKSHIKIVHRGEKPHLCTTCGGRFTTKALLSNHLNSHSNERSYKCDECDLTFKYQSGLWMHKLSHKGEKPHQCTICGSSFTLKGNLIGHMKTHSNEKPFECSVCLRKFPWKRNLKNHFKTHTKEQPLLQHNLEIQTNVLK